MNTLKGITNSFESYQQLISFYQTNKDKKFEDISLELPNWFSANLSAVLGGVLDKLYSNSNNINLDYIESKIKDILLKNNFLSYFGLKKTEDIFDTTIEYLKISPRDGKYFNTYVNNLLLKRKELPEMSQYLKEKIAEGIYEIFVNAQIHSETNSIYTCGQFFPKKNIIEFTITDIGIGFKNKINKRFNKNLTSIQAITWAIKDKNTTKENISGGIGLALLKEFITLNKGKMQIISDDGFYEYGTEGEILKTFHESFPGTIVNLQFRTDDDGSYVLKYENDDIF